MTAQPRSRASQYDPNDVSLFTFQQPQQQLQQQLQNTNRRASQELSYSSSNNSAATTFINLTGPNNSSTSVPISSSALSSSQNGQILSSLSPPTTSGIHCHSTSPPHSSSSSNGSTPLFSKTSASTPNPSNLIQPSSSTSATTTQPLQRLNLQYGGKYHAKSDSVASVRSKLVAKGSRSSLQLNLRTNQQSHCPTMITSPGISPGERVWNESQLIAPSPIYPTMMDSAFMKEHQLQQQQQQQERQTQSRRRGVGENAIGAGEAVSKDSQVQDLDKKQGSTAFCEHFALVVLSSVHSVMMVTAPFGVIVALTGYIGILSQSRKVLAIYSILLWPLFALITTVGYICFRRNHVSLYQKLKSSWINEYSRDDRLVIQNALSCCGYRSSGDYPSYDLHCFPRAPLPSCENLFLQYQQDLLSNTSSAAFFILPVQLLVMIVALLCSNHIDNLYRTAYPITPKLYTQ
ncbi:hypothetical protein EDD21DRAFT_354975 [Dissophora ornata]|nr:hypothetical protein EDD21DRAFT_354975 [Dissophora ornata]